MNPKAPKITEDMLAKAKLGDRDCCGQICKMMEPAIRTIVVRACKSYPHLDMDDLIQVGYLTVLKAIRRFDPDRKTAAFSSYAYESVLNKVRSAIAVESKHHGPQLGLSEDGVRAKLPQRVPIDGVELSAIEEPSQWVGADTEFFGRLSQLEAKIVALRLWGPMSGKRPTSWADIAKEVGVTRADCESIYMDAIEKIRDE